MGAMDTARALVIFSVLLFPAVFSTNTCGPNPTQVLVWLNDKTYNGFPFYFGNLSLVYSTFGITPQELEATRLTSLQWLNTQFGVPLGQASYDPTTGTTTIPGWGSLQIEVFVDCYNLISSTDPLVQNLLGQVHLKVLEFTFNTAPTNPNTVYGGRFGQLYQKFGIPATIQPADSLSSGYYYIFKNTVFGDIFMKRVAFRALYPTRADLPIRANEELQLFDEDWGEGVSVLRIENVQLSATNQDWSQITGVWRFPATSNAYQVLGI